MRLSLVQRHMFYRMTAAAAMTAFVFGVVVLLITTSELFAFLALGAIGVGRFFVALATLMPMICYFVGPLAVTIAVGYCYHEWIRHREILSLLMAGMSHRGVALPGVAAGAAAAVLTGVMSLYLLPVSFRHFEDIKYGAVLNLTIAALEEGYPQKVAPNVSVAFRKRLPDDMIEGVTVIDSRKDDKVTYVFADRGRFVVRRAAEGSRPEQVLALDNGYYVERREHDDEAPRPVNFETLVVPVSSIAGPPHPREWRGFFEEHIFRLLDPPAEVRGMPIEYGEWIAEGHKRIVMPLLCLGYVAFALGLLLQGSADPRSGNRAVRTLVIAVSVALWHGLTVVTHSEIVQEPRLVGTYYLLALAPLTLGSWLLSRADRGQRRAALAAQLGAGAPLS